LERIYPSGEEESPASESCLREIQKLSSLLNAAAERSVGERKGSEEQQQPEQEDEREGRGREVSMLPFWHLPSEVIHSLFWIHILDSTHLLAGL